LVVDGGGKGDSIFNLVDEGFDWLVGIVACAEASIVGLKVDRAEASIGGVKMGEKL
jgi:hypothetical protein